MRRAGHVTRAGGVDSVYEYNILVRKHVEKIFFFKYARRLQNVFMNPNHLKHEIMLANPELFFSYFIETTGGLLYEN